MKFTLSTRIAPSLSPQEFVELAAEVGYSALLPHGAVLPWDSPKAAAEALGSCAADSGIEVCAYDPGLGRLAESDEPSAEVERARRAGELARAMNCRRLILHASARPSQPRELPARLFREAQWIQELIDSSPDDPLGICIPIEPNTLAHDHFNAVGLLQRIDRFDVQIVFDPAELYAARADFTDKAVRAVEDRLGVFILRDFRSEAGKPLPARLAEGAVDWRPLLQRLTQIRFEGPVVVGTHLAEIGAEDVGELVRGELATARHLFDDAARP